MGLYVNSNDFEGQDKLAKDKFSVSDLDVYIEKYEVCYLQEMLGAKLYEEFATDFSITGVMPTAPKFQQIWNAFAVDNDCDVVKSEGIKKMLLLFIYFEYLRDSKVKNNIGGVNINTQVNSTEAEFHQTNLYTNYNEAVHIVRAIQWIICDNPNNYDWSNENMQPFKLNAWI